MKNFKFEVFCGRYGGRSSWKCIAMGNDSVEQSVHWGVGVY